MNKIDTIKLKFVANVFNGNSIPDDKKNEYEGKEIPSSLTTPDHSCPGIRG